MIFPIVTANLTATQSATFAQLVATAEAAGQAGSIVNPVFIETKSQINRLIETAWNAFISARYTYSRKYESLPEAVWQFSYSFTYPQLHSINGVLARVEKSKLAHPMIDDMRALLVEVAPLQELFTALKGMVVSGRKVKTDDADPRFVAPPVTGLAAKRVHTLLTALMTDSYEGLVEAFVGRMDREITALKDAMAASAAEGKMLSLRNYLLANKRADGNFLSRVTHDDRPASLAVIIDDDVDATIRQLAERDASEIREAFVAKNLRKIVSIMDAKEAAGVALNEARVISRTLSLGGFTGEFAATFADGSRFDFSNGVVWSHSIYGKQFCRYPLTFHNVTLANGSRMKQPSEKKMNAEFVGKV
jgi:hypothetical protein